MLYSLLVYVSVLLYFVAIQNKWRLTMKCLWKMFKFERPMLMINCLYLLLFHSKWNEKIGNEEERRTKRSNVIVISFLKFFGTLFIHNLWIMFRIRDKMMGNITKTHIYIYTDMTRWLEGPKPIALPLHSLNAGNHHSYFIYCNVW